MGDIKKIAKRLLFFEEPKKMEKFILKEKDYEEEGIKEEGIKEENSGTKKRCFSKKNDKKSFFKRILSFDFRGKKNAGKSIYRKGEGKKETGKRKKGEEETGSGETDKKEKEISCKLSENKEIMKAAYNIPVNGDIILREFEIILHGKPVEAFIIFIDGMTDRKIIGELILQPLMLLSNIEIKSKEPNIIEYIRKHLLPQNQVKIARTYREVIDEINFGGVGIFIDGSDRAFTVDVKGWEHRMVERPNTEIVIRGPQEGFTEVLRVNTALVRKILKDEDLVVENLEIGDRGKNACALMYIKDIADDSLVNEVRRRLKNVNIDYIIDSGELEQLIEDNTYLPVPQVVATERPDRAASFLSEGKVAVILNGSPFCLIVPATFASLIHSPEDSYIRFPYANFIRLVRISAIIISLLLPGLYIAVTNFHQEMIPTDLLLAISASRERMPFPSVVEMLIMEFSFELIREAGLRIPGPIGPTISIIGALILGQAAVSANIVSPVLIIIVAVTGLGSFAIPSFSLAFGLRILRFAYIVLGSVAGFLGITLGVFMHGLLMVSAKSFGVPFMAPFAPLTSGMGVDGITRAPIWENELRPDFLNAKDKRKQPQISRKWVRENDGKNAK